MQALSKCPGNQPWWKGWAVMMRGAPQRVGMPLIRCNLLHCARADPCTSAQVTNLVT